MAKAVGAKRAAETNRQKHGVDYYQRLGVLGGKAKVPKGFAVVPGLASRAGKLSGISRRGKAKK